MSCGISEKLKAFSLDFRGVTKALMEFSQGHRYVTVGPRRCKVDFQEASEGFQQVPVQGRSQGFRRVSGALRGPKGVQGGISRRFRRFSIGFEASQVGMPHKQIYL